MKRILVPTDFSDISKLATRVAIRIAHDLGAELVLAHAWYLPGLSFGAEPISLAGNLVEEMSGDARRGLDDALEDAKRDGASAVTATLLSGGPPWSRLVQVLEAAPAFDLVVIGTHGRTGFERVVLGSVAEKLVRHAPCSVLAIRGEPDTFTDVLCPIDFSESSQVVMSRAAQLVGPGGSGITLLHVVEAPTPTSGTFDALFVRDLEKAALRALDELARELRSKVEVPVQTCCRVGHAGAQILTMLDDEPVFDLVVVGSHGRTGLRRALLGSVAEKVVRHANRPVLVARSR